MGPQKKAYLHLELALSTESISHNAYQQWFSLRFFHFQAEH